MPIHRHLKIVGFYLLIRCFVQNVCKSLDVNGNGLWKKKKLREYYVLYCSLMVEQSFERTKYH